MKVGRGQDLQLPGGRGYGGGVLDLDAILANYACRGLHGIERARPAGSVLDIEEANVFAIGDHWSAWTIPLSWLFWTGAALPPMLRRRSEIDGTVWQFERNASILPSGDQAMSPSSQEAERVGTAVMGRVSRGILQVAS